jgi:hypothetical protein
MQLSPGLKDNLKAAAVVAVVAFIIRALLKQKQIADASVIPGVDSEVGTGAKPVDWSHYTYNQPAIDPIKGGLNIGSNTPGPIPNYSINILVPQITAPQFGTCTVCSQTPSAQPYSGAAPNLDLGGVKATGAYTSGQWHPAGLIENPRDVAITY